MEDEKNTFGRTVRLNGDLETALEMVAAALKKEEFGILTEIDVKKTLKTKLDVDFRPYRILGACNPKLAYKALSNSPNVGLLLPCNVTVSQIKSDQVEVAFLDPLSMLGVSGDSQLLPIAEEAKKKLDRVASSLENQ